MVTPTPADIAAALAGKLHSGVNGYRCRCGACAHQCAQAARITGRPPPPSPPRSAPPPPRRADAPAPRHRCVPM